MEYQDSTQRLETLEQWLQICEGESEPNLFPNKLFFESKSKNST